MIEPQRYFPAVAIGGGLAGVVLGIPFLGDLLRGCLCVGVMAGAAASMKLWLDAHQAEDLTSTDAMALGATSGGVSAVVSWALSVPVRIGVGEGLAHYYAGATSLPEMVRTNLQALYDPSPGMVIMSLPVSLGLYAVMGAVGGFIAIQTAFKARRDAA